MSEQWAVHNTVIKNINDLIEYDSNPREHTPEQVEQVANSIREFGWTMPILIDEANEIIAGHGRLMAGKQLGIKEVPCIIAKGWSDEQKKAYCIADNKLTENSTWSKDFLKLNLTNLYDNEFDLKLTGFSDDELSKLLPDFNIDEGLTDEDDVPTPPEEPITKLGDIWLCGQHRVMCGDSTSADDFAKLMNGKKADMVHTDPPYNVSIGTIKHSKFKMREIKNDSMSGSEFMLFCEQWSENIKSYCDGIIYCWGGQGKDGRIMFTVLDNKFHNSTTIMWYKDVFTLGRGKYQNQYEPCWFGWNESGQSFSKERNLINVWKVNRPKKSELHPTMKPIELCDIPIKDSSKINDIILDVFLGSGSTLISCQKLQRICYGLELDPKYCDVIVKRWQNYTGLEATLESDGAKFNDMLK
tara:strand:- start:227 stop:1465 length:1239 start_codon:yes stop_codon:yes gene_type:complete